MHHKEGDKSTKMKDITECERIYEKTLLIREKKTGIKEIKDNDWHCIEDQNWWESEKDDKELNVTKKHRKLWGSMIKQFA